MTVVSISYSQLYLTWSPPKNPNGIIIGYNVTWIMVSNDKLENVSGVLKVQKLSRETSSHEIQDLGKYIGTVN